MILQAAFTKRRLGAWRSTLDRGQVELVNAPTQFSATVAPGFSSETTLQIPENTAVASIQIAWGPLLSTNELDLQVYDPSGVLRADSANLNLPGLTGKRERVVLTKPAAGAWSVRVRHKVSLLASSQQFTGVLELGEARYRRLNDIGGLSPALRDDIHQSIRSFAMLPVGVRFRPDMAIQRSELASALVLGARIPQYLAGQPTYRDARDTTTRLFVESVQACPEGPLFVDVTQGGSFRPNDSVTRLTAAIALVRAAGLRAKAEAKAGTALAYLDAGTIPSEWRGYVAVAVENGLIKADTMFRPQGEFTRAEVAIALAAIQRRVS
ncbi:MAG TPA: S-layer homology domain-containing protein [Pyrinomonadaceae bacterium]|nr:S-layer homology domain-containing protein [Pyrinomonadaceae bacterium]